MRKFHKMKNKKAQGSIEFIVITGFILVMFIVILGVIQERSIEKSKEKREIALKDTAKNIQKEINLAFESTNGYTRSFEVPGKIINAEYNITLVKGLVYLETLDKKNAIALPIPEITGIIKNGTNTIRKINNTVIIN